MQGSLVDTDAKGRTQILLSDLSEWMESLAVGSVHIVMIVWKWCGEMIKGTIAFI